MFAEIDVRETNKNPKCSNLAGAGLWSGRGSGCVRSPLAGPQDYLYINHQPLAWMLNILLQSRAIELPITRRNYDSARQ